MFPIGWMYYFGTNLDQRFSVPDFWPAPGTTNKIPFDREEQKDLDKKLRELRLAKKQRRLERERLGLAADTADEGKVGVSGEDDQGQSQKEEATPKEIQTRNTFGISAIERWARGK